MGKQCRNLTVWQIDASIELQGIMLGRRFQILEESRECISYINSCSLSVNKKNEEQMRSAIFSYFVIKQLVL